MSLKTETYIFAEINLKAKNAPLGETKIITVGNKSATHEALYTGSPYIYGVLVKVSLGSVDVRQPLPRVGRSSITLADVRGTIKHDFRFRDFLYHYTVANQVITVKRFVKTKGITGSSADVEVIAKGRMQDVSIDTEANTLTITFSDILTLDDVATSQIRPSAFPSVDSSSNGRFVPVVFGSDVQTEAIPVNVYSSSMTYATYVYASNFGPNHFVGGLNSNVLMKVSDTEAREIVSATDQNTPVYSMTISTFSGTGKSLSSVSGKRLAWILTSPSSTYLITHLAASFKIGGSEIANVWFEIYKEDPNTNKPDFKAKVKTEQVLVSSIPAGDRDIILPLEEAFLMESGVTYFFAVAWDQEDANLKMSQDTTLTAAQWDLFDTDAGGKYWAKLTSINQPQIKAYAAEIFDVPASANEFAYFQVQQRSVGHGTNQPDISHLQLIAQTDGLKDDASGTITGSASSLITDANDAVALLYKEAVGDLTDLDRTTYSLPART
ncbi:hypothetical protein D6827_02255, partial [Candidatus Parcubacteria bacterium]